ncbi:hypothetical protein [Labrenzia sp. OB1]|uniref:hypothetical protein n=1 Tax=Labrenzia sp. OB1 TaxID=1561204 RepID=UPI000AAD3F4E|nr:hypothetical protein [Labrenzia sp. OB1]
MFNIYSGLAFLALITGLLVLIRMDRKGGRKAYSFPMRNTGPVAPEDKTGCSKTDVTD